MKMRPVIKTLLVDIGGVLLTNDWDPHARQSAARRFHLNREEMEERHHLNFDTLRRESSRWTTI